MCVFGPLMGRFIQIVRDGDILISPKLLKISSSQDLFRIISPKGYWSIPTKSVDFMVPMVAYRFF